MARARAASAGIVWPAGLAVCEASDWIRDGDDLDDPIVPGYVCWMRWVDARYQLLILLGAPRDDAQVDAVGDFPSCGNVI